MAYKEAMQISQSQSADSKLRKPMLQSLHGEVSEYVPVWLMRQAGRYLPEYRALRAEAGSFLKLCYTPSMAAEATLQPLRRFDLDAAILFSDILVIPHALGMPLDFVEGEGPVLAPLSKLEDFDRLDIDHFEQKLSPVYETLDILSSALDPERTLIGFAGAPWTVACYMIQGHGGGRFEKACDLAKADPEAFSAFLIELAEITAQYLMSQIKHGADTVQIFDSWAGLVPDAYFEDWIVKPAAHIVQKIKAVYPQTPVIGFPRQARGHYTAYAQKTGVSALGLDPDADIDAIPASICLQGNLSPELLLKGGDDMRASIRALLEKMAGRPYIFNLGHGVIKETPPEHVADLIATIRGFKRDSSNNKK